MEPHSQVNDSPQSRRVLEGQLRECFGRVVYTHKTHEKAADILDSIFRLLKVTQIALSALITGSFVFRFFGLGDPAIFVAMALSAVLLGLNLYMKDRNMSEAIHKHKQSANDIWLIRERYQSLLTDLVMENKTLDSLLAERDALMTTLHSAYSTAPSTNSRAYRKAQKALKQDEDMTFSDKEIDDFLPQELKRTQNAVTDSRNG